MEIVITNLRNKSQSFLRNHSALFLSGWGREPPGRTVCGCSPLENIHPDGQQWRQWTHINICLSLYVRRIYRHHNSTTFNINIKSLTRVKGKPKRARPRKVPSICQGRLDREVSYHLKLYLNLSILCTCFVLEQHYLSVESITTSFAEKKVSTTSPVFCSFALQMHYCSYLKYMYEFSAEVRS